LIAATSALPGAVVATLAAVAAGTVILLGASICKADGAGYRLSSGERNLPVGATVTGVHPPPQGRIRRPTGACGRTRPCCQPGAAVCAVGSPDNVGWRDDSAVRNPTFRSGDESSTR